MRRFAFIVTLSLTVAGCAHQQSLYDRMGGAPVMTAIADSFIARFADDSRVAPTFAKTDIPKFRQHLIEQFCELTGGGCKYTGRTMKAVHEGMHLTESQFNALVEDLQDAMALQRVPIGLQNEFIAKLAPLRPDIIHR
jgi:hemoglobin